jgi:membrane protein implicated in regulation of membrane protease activity
MTALFLVCAVVGGTLLACQFLLSLFGIGDHHGGLGGHDAHLDHGGAHDHGGSGSGSGSAWFFSILTFRSIVSALAFFGIAGMAASSAGWSRTASLGVAAAAGVAALLLVAVLMRTLFKLQDEGNVRIENAVGQTGTVYLTVPGNKAGVGKVTLSLQNRTTEFQAVTFQDQLPTGSKVVVVDVIGPETVEVIAAPQYGRMAHA